MAIIEFQKKNKKKFMRLTNAASLFQILGYLLFYSKKTYAWKSEIFMLTGGKKNGGSGEEQNVYTAVPLAFTSRIKEITILNYSVH